MASQAPGDKCDERCRNSLESGSKLSVTPRQTSDPQINKYTNQVLVFTHGRVSDPMAQRYFSLVLADALDAKA